MSIRDRLEQVREIVSKRLEGKKGGVSFHTWTKAMRLSFSTIVGDPHSIESFAQMW